MTFTEQLTQWYGAPRTRAEVPATEFCQIGGGVDQLSMAARFVAEGHSASIISSAAQHAHWFVPHPANIAVTHEAFFHAIDPDRSVPQEDPLSEVWNDRGLVLYEWGWKLEALECFCRSVTADPQNGSPWVNFGRFFMEPEVRDYAFADLCLAKAVALNSALDMAWANRAVIALTNRKVEEATQLGERAFTLNAENAIAHLALGQAYGIQMRSLSARAQLDCARKAMWHLRRAAGLLPRPDIVRPLLPHMKACEAVLHTPRPSSG